MHREIPSGKVAGLIAFLGILDNQRIYIASLFFSCLQSIELQFFDNFTFNSATFKTINLIFFTIFLSYSDDESENVIKVDEKNIHNKIQTLITLQIVKF